MNLLEDTLEPVLDQGLFATLALVSTVENLREWTCYAISEDEFMARLNYACAGMSTFPIEIHIPHDPSRKIYAEFTIGLKNQIVNRLGSNVVPGVRSPHSLCSGWVAAHPEVMRSKRFGVIFQNRFRETPQSPGIPLSALRCAVINLDE